MQKGFIRNINLIQENSNVDDLLDLTERIGFFQRNLENYPDYSMIALRGRFGIGKSTFLNQLKNKFAENKDILWFDFDAWKFPNRDNLWESFVLEFARSLNTVEFDKILRKIDGKTPTKWVEKFVDFSSGFYSSVQNFNNFLNSSPARRTFEIQDILTDLVKNIKQNDVYIIVEDIDRSGDKGIYFLETLNYYIKATDFPTKRIRIIVPISDHSYEENKYSYHKFFDDIIIYHNPEYKLQKFCEEVFINEITGRQKDGTFTSAFLTTRSNEFRLLLEFLEGLFIYHNDIFTLRELKLLLRNANQLYLSLCNDYASFEKGKMNTNFLLCILVSSMKFTYFKVPDKLTHFDSSKSEKEFLGSGLQVALITAIFKNRSTIFKQPYLLKYSDARSGGIIISKINSVDYEKSKKGILDKMERNIYLSDLYFR